jgi:hypothetical protein
MAAAGSEGVGATPDHVPSLPLYFAMRFSRRFPSTCSLRGGGGGGGLIGGGIVGGGVIKSVLTLDPARSFGFSSGLGSKV